MDQMFQNAESMDVDLGKWNVSRLEDAESMFEGASSYTGQGIDGWSTSRLRSMKATFK